MGKPVIARLARIAGLVIPSACREEVLGDLHERSNTALEFCIEAMSTIPCVIFSRIRRVADVQLLLLQAGIVYLCYWAAVWFEQHSLFSDDRGLLHLILPAALVLLGILFEDVYAPPGPRSPWLLIRGPVIGFALSLILEAALWGFRSWLALPLLVVMYGAVLSLVLTSAVRLLFASKSAAPKGPQPL